MGVEAADTVERTVEVYKAGVKRAFGFLKETSRLDDLYVKSVPLDDGAGYLLPVCELHASDQRLISLLSAWRAENSFAFPSQFPVTDEGTARWLRANLLDVDDRLLFLVVDPFGREVGHLGFANAINDTREVEVDNVVRGARGSAPGIMSAAMRALVRFAEETLQPESIFLRVFDDNTHAIDFYRRLGFADGGLLPLRRHAEGDAVFYRPCDDGEETAPDKRFLRMDLAASAADYVPDELILTAGPAITARETSYAFDAVRHGWNRRWSDYLTEFERSFADFIGVKHALATSSCTGALHLSFAALGLGPGDEVIVPDLTWVATANAVTYVGATPVFADIEPDSWCLDPASVGRAITERTKAIVPVHLYGHPARMDAITELAREHGLRIVEDAAPAIGAEWRGQRTGTFGDLAAFSFQGAKLLVTGEGGIVVTDDDDLYAKLRVIWDQGRNPGTFWIDHFGLKYKMSNVQAALGLGQLQRVEELIEAKRRIFGWYADGLDGLDGVTLNWEVPGARSIYWMTSILLDEMLPVTRDGLIAALKERRVDTRPVFPSISRYPIWERRRDESHPVAGRVAARAMNLPSGVLLRRAEVTYVCRSIREVLEGAK